MTARKKAPAHRRQSVPRRGAPQGPRRARLYQLVLREVELPLFRSVMDYAEGNQSRAATILGINRGTLRKKLRDYGLAE